MWSSRPYTFDRVVRIFFTMIAVCIVLYFAYILRHVLLPFIAACLIAYLIDPFIRWNQKIFKIKSHTWGVGVTILETLVVCAILCLILVPIINKEFAQLGSMLSHYFKYDHPALNGWFAQLHAFVDSHLDMDKIIEDVQRINITEAVDNLWHDLTGGLEKILGILGWCICLVYVIFILLDFDKYKNGVKNYVPDRYKPVVSEIFGDLSFTMKTYFRKQALISLIVGVCYGIGFSIVGIPMAVVIGLMNIILFMVPYLVYLSLIPVTAMCVFHSMETGGDFWVIWLECIAVYVFVEAFSDLLLTPRIMGKALGLNPAIILLSLSIWGSLLGILGMLIALPASTIIIKWAKIGLANWRDKLNSASPGS